MTIDEALGKLERDLAATEGRSEAIVSQAVADRDAAVRKAERERDRAVKAAHAECDEAIVRTRRQLARTRIDAVARFDEQARKALGLDEAFRIRSDGGRLELVHGGGLLASASPGRDGWSVQLADGSGLRFLGGGGDGAELGARSELWRTASTLPVPAS